MENKCKYCGVDLPHFYMTICNECMEKNRFDRARKINVKDYNGAVYEVITDSIFESIDDMRECYESEGIDLPKYVYACETIKFGLDMTYIVEDELLNYHFEDAKDFIDYDTLEDLQKIVDEWTQQQNITTYEADFSTVVIL